MNEASDEGRQQKSCPTRLTIQKALVSRPDRRLPIESISMLAD